MMKPIIAALLLSTAVPAFAVPEEIGNEKVAKASADPAGEKALGDVMSLFSKMFDTSDQPEPDAARQELAKVTAAKLIPNGAYNKIMDDMLGKMLTPLFDMMPGLTDAQIAASTGASEEIVSALSEEQKAAVTQIIDPNHKERGKQILDVMKPMMVEAMAIIEPAMRTGLSRAYARKFTALQLNTINNFFLTPTGSAFAQESFALQADPEVMQATFKAFPAIFGSIMGDEAKFKAKFDALPKQRELKDLSDAELQQLAELLGVEKQVLQDHRTSTAAASSDTPETGEEPWYAEENWLPANRSKATKLSDAYVKANTKSDAAYSAYEDAQVDAIDEARQRFLAKGWKAEPAPEPMTAEDIPDDSVPPPAASE
jgi:hypothetical protein